MAVFKRSKSTSFFEMEEKKFFFVLRFRQKKYPVNKGWNLQRAIERGVLRVNVKMSKCGHGYSLLIKRTCLSSSAK